MIDLLRDRLSKADRVIVQIAAALKPFMVQRRANRPGGCYCVADCYESGDPHTAACDRLNRLMASSDWYLKKEAEMPKILEDEREMLLFGIRNAVATTAHITTLKAGDESEAMIKAIADELIDLGFRREPLNVYGPGSRQQA